MPPRPGYAMKGGLLLGWRSAFAPFAPGLFTCFAARKTRALPLTAQKRFANPCCCVSPLMPPPAAFSKRSGQPAEYGDMKRSGQAAEYGDTIKWY